MKTIAEEVLAVLHAIEAGKIALKPIRCPQSLKGSNVQYDASNGWRLVVFNDSNKWDYLDSVILPNGDEYDFWAQGLMTEKWDDGYEAVRDYEPSDLIAWERYRLPGYELRKKCTCGAIACVGMANGRAIAS